MKIAVIKAKGHQYLVREGDLLKVPTLSLQEGDTAVFDRVLYLDGEIGRPHIQGAKVKSEVVRHGRYKKVIIFKHNPKKRYKKKQGHRQGFTEVKITGITV